jgi:hypothetical protein
LRLKKPNTAQYVPRFSHKKGELIMNVPTESQELNLENQPVPCCEQGPIEMNDGRKFRILAFCKFGECTRYPCKFYREYTRKHARPQIVEEEI